MTDQLLMIFVKNLIPGLVKTRLAEDIGIEKALDVYMELVNHTNRICQKVDANRGVYYSEYVELEDNWDDGVTQPHVQKGNTLGEKMQNAFDQAFDSYSKVVIIGSDCYELSTKIINDAFTLLEENDVVIGPAKDGGFYLLGLSEYLPQLFEGREYSHSKVLEELLATVEELELSVHKLPTLSDIDTFEDLKASGIDWKSLGENDDYMPDDYDPDSYNEDDSIY